MTPSGPIFGASSATPMQARITFSTACDDHREEVGTVVSSDPLRIDQGETRPDFRVRGDVVDLISTKSGHVVEEFGRNATVDVGV